MWNRWRYFTQRLRSIQVIFQSRDWDTFVAVAVVVVVAAALGWHEEIILSKGDNNG